MNEQVLPLVNFDLGHGGTDPGACANGIKEKDINLIVGAAAYYHLKNNYRVRVGATRLTDVSLDENTRVKLATDNNPTLVVSIHHNAAASTTARGSEIIHEYYDKTDDILAQKIQGNLKEIGMPANKIFSKLNDQGKNYYFMIRRIIDSDTRAIIVEGGYVTNAEDVKLLRDTNFLREEGVAIAKAIADFLKLETIAKNSSEVKVSEPVKPVTTPMAEDWGKPYIEKLKTMGIIGTSHDSKESVEWDEFAKVICEVCERAGIK